MTDAGKKTSIPLKENPGQTSFAQGSIPVQPLSPSSSAGVLPDMPQAEPRQAHLDIALDWLLRARQKPDDQQLQAELRDWRDATPENAEALRRAERVWSLTGRLAPTTADKWPPIPASAGDADPSPPAAAPLPVPDRPRAHRRRSRAWAAGIAVAACLVMAFAPTIRLTLESDYRTAQNDRRSIELPDGSRAFLDADSAVAVTYTPGERGIRLLRGQAFFEVRPDPARPFMVSAQELDVTVTGTAFNVDLNASVIEVAVEHGSVRVSEHGSARVLNPGLGAGQRLDFDRDSHTARLDRQPPGRVATWRNGQLVADNARLGDMVAELQRYVPGRIWLKNERLADLRITGVYDIRNPQAALRAMAQPHGVRLDQWTPWLTVLDR